MKTTMCYIAAVIIYAAIICSIIAGVIIMICGVYYGNCESLIMDFIVFILGLFAWCMSQDM